MFDWTGHRVHGHRFELLTNTEEPVGLLTDVTGGFLDWKQGRAVRGGGQLTVAGPDATRIDWLNHRVRVTYWARDPAGQEAEIPLGVFFGATPGHQLNDGLASTTVDLFDKTLILDEDLATEAYAVDAGTNVTAHVRSMIAATGETKIAITASTETLRVPMVWKPGTTKLQIINELLRAVEYGALEADGDGWFIAGPYVAPSKRTPVWEFSDGETAIHSANITREADYTWVPNVVACHSTATGDAPTLIAVARNDDPTSRFSTVSRGRPISRVEENVEATSQAVLQAKADRLLAEGMQVVDSAEFSHAPVPIRLGDVVHLVDSVHDVDLVAPVTTMMLSLTEPELVAQTRIGVSVDVADVLLSRTDPAAPTRFGTVTQASPLRVQLDSDGASLPVTPTTLVPVNTGDRVLVETVGHQMTVLGTVGGATPTVVGPLPRGNHTAASSPDAFPLGRSLLFTEPDTSGWPLNNEHGVLITEKAYPGGGGTVQVWAPYRSPAPGVWVRHWFYQATSWSGWKRLDGDWRVNQPASLGSFITLSNVWTDVRTVEALTLPGWTARLEIVANMRCSTAAGADQWVQWRLLKGSTVVWSNAGMRAAWHSGRNLETSMVLTLDSQTLNGSTWTLQAAGQTANVVSTRASMVFIANG